MRYDRTVNEVIAALKVLGRVTMPQLLESGMLTTTVRVTAQAALGRLVKAGLATHTPCGGCADGAAGSRIGQGGGMSETLIPFDFAEFEKEPSRLRHNTYPLSAPVCASAVGGRIVALWPNMKNVSIYDAKSNGFACLRLVAKTRVVKIRLSNKGLDSRSLRAWSSDEVLLTAPRSPLGEQWFGETFEREVEA